MIKTIALSALLLAACIKKQDWHTYGLPLGAVCANEHEGVKQCIGDGKLFVCVLDYNGLMMQCAPGVAAFTVEMLK